MATIGAANDPQSFIITLPDEDTPASPFSALFEPLANSVLAALVRLKNQVQSVQGFSNKISEVSGWDIQAQYILVVGETMAQIHLQLKKTGSKLVVPADGNMGNVVVANLVSGFEPQAEAHLGTGDTGRLGAGYATSDGAIKLSALSSGTDIAVNDVISLVGFYPLNNPVRSTI